MDECRSFQELMLEADPEELSGSADTPLSVHLLTCPECESIARRFREGEAGLRRIMSSLGPQRPIGAAPRPPARRRHWAWASLATAAALSLWFGLRANGPPVTNVNPRAAPTGHSRQAVTVATNQNVVIMSTTNPDITIMWFYQ